MLQATPIGLGHNRSIIELLADRYSDEIEAADQGAAAAMRITRVSDADGLNAAAAVVRLLRERDAELDARRTFEKRQYDIAGADVQAFFASSRNKLAEAKRHVEHAITTYNREIEVQQRQRALEAAAAEREEANRRQAEAAALETKGHGVAAQQLNEYAEKSEATAEHMEARANASAATLVRTAVDGGLVTARGFWAFVITEPAVVRQNLGQLGDHFTAVEIDKAIRSYMKAEDKAGRTPALPGVLFRRDSKAVVR